MRFVTFDDPLGDQVVVNVDLIRTMDGDTDNDGPLTDIFFDADHKQTVRGSLSDTHKAIIQAVENSGLAGG
jgi:redox-regulated HSP33 family molecular chaperone